MNARIDRFREWLSWRLHRQANRLSSLDRLYSKRWYYSVELIPGRVTKGIYPDDLPMLPRMMLRRCRVAGADCLDIGSMEGLMPTLMARQGARSVLATDFSAHCASKLAAVQRQYAVDFKFRSVGLLYDMPKHLRSEGFDLVNLSGVLYHVLSPLLVLAAVRPLIKRGGLLIVSTNVIQSDGHFMEFNNASRLQVEANTFWYPSIVLFDYLLRFMKLAPIDCVYLPHTSIRAGSVEQGGEYVFDKPSGYLSVVCRATDDVVAHTGDAWMQKVAGASWEHLHRVDWRRATRQPRSTIDYAGEDGAPPRDDAAPIDLFETIGQRSPVKPATDPRDSHTLRLADWT